MNTETLKVDKPERERWRERLPRLRRGHRGVPVLRRSWGWCVSRGMVCIVALVWLMRKGPAASSRPLGGAGLARAVRGGRRHRLMVGGGRHRLSSTDPLL